MLGYGDLPVSDTAHPPVTFADLEMPLQSYWSHICGSSTSARDRQKALAVDRVLSLDFVSQNVLAEVFFEVRFSKLWSMRHSRRLMSRSFANKDLAHSVL